MLTEEALLLIVTLGAFVLVVLGTLELIAPSRRRNPRRGGRRMSTMGALGRPPDSLDAATRPGVAGASLEICDRNLRGFEHARNRGRRVGPALDSRVPQAPARGDLLQPAQPARLGTAATAVTRCTALLGGGRYADVVAEATAALAPRLPGAASVSSPMPPRCGRCWGSHVTPVGDDEGARAALESALALAPPRARTEYEARLIALALRAARARLDRAAGEQPCEPEERVAGIRDAIAWLDRGIALGRRDGALLELRLAAWTALGPAYEEAARSLAERHEYLRARCLLGEALADADVVAARGEELRDLLSAIFNSEIGHLSARALSLHKSRETEALASLRRAEDLLATMPGDVLSTARREEVGRRLLRGYTRLGRRRLQIGQFEAALEPLLHALRFDPSREAAAETRDVLVQALEALVEARAPGIRDLMARGERESALLQCDKLWALLTSGREAGLTHDDLAPAFGGARRLVECLDVPA